MHRFLGTMGAAVLVSLSGAREATASVRGVSGADAPLNVAALLTAAHGAPPMICALAAQSVRNYGWSDWGDAPYTPLATTPPLRSRDGGRAELTPEDVARLLDALASPDECVRELSIRLLGGQRKDVPIATALVTRLTSADASMREVAAFGLGMIAPASAVSPLISALHDATPNVRANSAWALGRIEDGRALAGIVGLFRDADEKVRGAAVVAAGRIDSVSTVAALMRVLQQDDSPSVRRVAAWALGQKDAREAAGVLATTLAKEPDARVREMVAWALGNTGGTAGGAALTSAVRRDADDNVRETAAWALAEIRDRSAVDVLGGVAGDDHSSRVRGTAAWALGELRSSGGKAPPGLLKALRDESEDTRLKAAWALGQIGDPAALDAIRDALKAEKGSRVGKALVRALIKSGGRSEETLTQLLSSSDPAVREAAVRGLAGSESFNPWPWPWPRPRPFP